MIVSSGSFTLQSVLTCTVLEEAPTDAGVLGFLIPLLRQGSQYDKGSHYVQLIFYMFPWQITFILQFHKHIVIVIILS